MLQKKYLLSVLASALLLAACSKNPCVDGSSEKCQQIRVNYINALNQRDIKVVRLISKTLIFLPSDHLFEDNSSTLSAQGEQDLNNVIALLRIYPSAKIKVSAYTDNILPSDLRYRLSQRQAREVAGYLWSENIPAQYQQLHYKGHGDKNPIASNRYYTGMAQNRRIVITVHSSCCQIASAK